MKNRPYLDFELCRGVAHFVITTSVLAVVGCGTSHTEQPTAPTAAPRNWQQQIDDVRAGRSDLIEVADERISDTQLSALVGLRELRVLLIDQAEITDAGLASLEELEPLEHLRIRGGSIGDDGLREITKIQTLRILNLPQVSCTDQGLAALWFLPKLEQLRLGSPHVTDAGLAELKNFPALRRLHFIGIPLTDKSIDDIAAIPQLESFYVDDSQITDAGFERLFQARPDLHVHVNQTHHDRDPRKDEG